MIPLMMKKMNNSIKSQLLNPGIKFIWVLICIMVFSSVHLLAQTGNDLPGQNIIVLSDIKPLLSEAKKVRFNPKLPPVETNTPDLIYSLPSRSLTLPYQVPDVKPLAKKAEKLPPLKNVYAKIGFGNYTTPYLDLYINSGRDNSKENASNNSNLGLRVGYISSKGSLPEQQFSDFKAKAFGTFYVDRAAIGVQIKYDRNVNYFYGYNPEVDTVIAKLGNQQIYNSISGGLSIKNAKKTANDINYDGHLIFNYLNDRFKQNEVNPVFDFGLSKTLDNGHSIGGTVLVDHNTFKNDTATQNSTILAVIPSYRIHNDDWLIDIGAYIGGDDEGLVIFPDIFFEKTLVEKIATFHASFKGKAVRNNYKSLSDENRFLDYNPQLHNSRELGISAGIKGNPAGNFNYNVQVTYNNVRFLPVFVNSMDSLHTHRFDVLYDTNASVLNPHLELEYGISEKLRLSAFVDIYSYTLNNLAKAWHLPAVKAGLSVNYKITDRITTHADFLAYGSRKALTPQGTEMTLKGVVDINLGGSYKINDSFHIFANINNIASSRFQKWYLYPTYGINALAGLKMIF